MGELFLFFAGITLGALLVLQICLLWARPRTIHCSGCGRALIGESGQAAYGDVIWTCPECVQSKSTRKIQ